ncbi:MAG TPA: PAS domain S-box protein [Aquabacterium sp.]|uniref:sensor histidine kinase n=1 Tax=Aquabacterium sp. TaxID=1872578 RepID=UPI002E348C28|nr:PAS domain S-box protein [Aquabacterium sp.]HEX5355171.1 PAS domain S-box protein [Aquabacterium sp.]
MNDLQVVLSAMSEGIVIQDRDGRVIEVNDAAQSILGLTYEQLLGRTSMEARWRSVREDGADWPGAEHPSMVALRSARPQRNQIMGVDAPDRGRRWIKINASPIFDDGCAQPSRVVASFVDVTEQVDLQARLAQSIDELGDLYNNAPCGYHTLDSRGRFLRINETELRWLGLSREEVLGRLGPTDFFTDEGRQVFQRHFPDVLAGRAIEGLEVDLVGRTGERRRVSVHASVVRDADGRFLHTRSVLHDITSLQQARQVLEQVTLDQSTMLNNDLIGMVKVIDRRFVWVNPGMTRIFGYAPHELVNQPTRLLFLNDEDHQSFGRAILADRSKGEYARAQSRMRRKDGRVLWIDVNAALLSEQSGESLGFMTDITELKEGEEARFRAVQLELENQRVKELLREREELLDVLAHEVRQPLNNASAALQSATGSMEPARSEQMASPAARARQVIHDVQACIDNTLSVASLLMAKGPIQREDVDIDMVVNLAIGDMAPRQVGRVLMERRTETRTASLDVGLMRLALRNLLSNALKFSPESSPVVIRLSDCDQPLALLVDVVDAGGGIAPDLWPSLFERDDRTRPVGGGRRKGLGLYIVRRVMELHGGSVQILRSDATGTTMRLLIAQGGDY